MALAVLAAGWAITLIGLIWVMRQRERDRRQDARERREFLLREERLLDRTMYLIDKPWTLPEAEPVVAPADPFEDYELPEMAALEAE